MDINLSFNQETMDIGMLGRQGENNETRLVIDCQSVLEEHPDAVIGVRMMGRLPGEKYYDLPVTREDGSVYTAKLSTFDMCWDGNKEIQLRAMVGEWEKRSARFHGYVAKSLFDFRPPVGVVSDWLDDLKKALAKADAADEHGPVIKDGLWYVWQDGAYVNTGVKAEGVDGEKGPKGDKGDNGEDATDEQVMAAVEEYLAVNPIAGTSIHIGPKQPTNGEMYWLDTSDAWLEVVDYPEEPEEPDEPEVTITGITATYTGGDVAVGTALADLTGIVVTATYSDGSTAPVTGYELSGTIAEGSNTILVTYEGMTATFTVTGIAEEEPEQPSDSAELMNAESIVATGRSITHNAKYSFYEFGDDVGTNIYEIPVEAGKTYIASMTNKNQYGDPYWDGNKLNSVKGETTFAITETKITDFTATGRVTCTFDGNTVIDTSGYGATNNGDGTYTRSIKFTPAISGYLYTDDRTSFDGSGVPNDTVYSIKEAVQ